MLVIRLSRVGKKNQAIYRMVVTEKEKAAKGKSLEEVGTYNPRFDENNIKLNQERIKYWLEKGAQPSSTVSGLLKKEGLLPEKLVVEYDKQIEHMKKHKKSNKKKEATEKEAGDGGSADKPKPESPEAPKEEKTEPTPKQEEKPEEAK